MFVIGYICALACFVHSAKVPVEVHPGETLQGLLTPGVNQRYLLKLDSASVAELVLHQGGADLIATVLSPNGDRLIVDERENGPEPILIDAREAGVYQLEVSTNGRNPKAIPYRLTAGAFRPKQEEDDLRLDAQRLSTSAKQLSSGKPSDLREAVELCSRALDLQRRLGDRKAQSAVLLQSGAYLLQLSEFELARAQLTQALSMAQKESELWTEGSTLNNLGVVHWQAGEFSEAIRALNGALQIWKNLGYKYGQAATLSNLGLWYRARGSYQEALRNYRQSLSILIALDDKPHEAYTYNNLGVLQLSLAEVPEALVSFKRAVWLYRISGNGRGEARAMIHVAQAYADRHQSKRLLKYLEQALPLAESATDYRSIGDGLELYGQLLAAAGDAPGAREKYETALANYRKISNPAGEASVLQSIGVLCLQTGKSDDAMNYLGQALTIRHGLGLKDQEAETLFHLAQVERKQNDLHKARTHIEAALDLIESVRALVSGPQFRMSYMASKNQYYSFACSLYYQLARESANAEFAQRGFELSERSRARSLLDLMAEAKIGSGAELRADLVARERRLHEELNALADSVANLSNQSNRKTLEAATSKLDATLNQYYELESEIRDADPRYARFAPRPATVAEIQKTLLDDDTVLFEYALGTTSSELWVLTTNSVRLFGLPRRASVERAARQFFQWLKNSNRPDASIKLENASNAGQILSHMLLRPASVALTHKRIVIVGDGILQRVPFGALPGASDVPLVEEHEIVFLPSASVLVEEHNDSRKLTSEKRTIAVVADPVFDAGDARIINPAPSIKPAFARLPYTRKEADTILSLAPADQSFRAFDFDATRLLFLSGQMAKYRMIHIATHAVVDAAHPELSELVFSQVDKNGNNVNGRLRLHEIASLRLDAQLVTLSACGTALGEDIRGEGTVGFARGFIGTGVTTVIVSLWDVEDESTAELMELFYQGVLGAHHLRPPAALREAQRTMRQSKRWRPYQWSGWIAVGDWR